MKLIISENQFSNLFIRRRIDNLHNSVIAEYRWLDPKRKRFDDYDNYFARVVFGAVNNFFMDNLNYDTVDDLISVRDASLPIMKEFISQYYGDEIRAHYEKERMK